MVTGLLRPDQGTVEVAGHDVWRDPVEVKARIGVLPEGLRLFERLSGRELLAYTGRLRGLPGAEVDKRAAQLLDVLDLAGAQHKLVVDYSTGMRKKIGLAAALLHNPRSALPRRAVRGRRPGLRADHPRRAGALHRLRQDHGHKNVAPGQAGLATFSIIGGMLAGAALCAPVLGITIWMHLAGGHAWLWLVLPLGAAYGVGVTIAALRISAPQAAARLPEILTAVSKG